MLSFVLLLTAIDACGIYLYEHDHFGGGVHYYNKDTPRTVWEDEYSSAKVVGEPGCHAWVYEHANFGGWGKRLDVGTYTKHQLWVPHRVHSDAISSVKVVNLCNLWGCTCQGMSEKYLTHYGVSWGTVPQQAEEANIAAWWKGRDCRTKPTCAAWGCTCQGLSDTYGTIHGVTFGAATLEAKGFWNANACKTSPNNRCLAKHCNGHWKLKPAAWKIVCPGGNCHTNTNMCCQIDGCDKVRVVGISWKKADLYVGEPQVKHLSAYTVDGENCGVSQEKPLDSFVRTKEWGTTHEESMELGTSLENTFGWSHAQSSTIEWSETASSSMDVPIGEGSVGVEQSSTKAWSRTSTFAQDGGVSKGAHTNKLTGISKQVTETIEFNGISKDVPPYAWYRHRAYYMSRPVHLTFTMDVQCIINGVNAMQKKIPGSKIVTATESHLKFEPMEDLTGQCKNTHPEYGMCTCFGELRSNFHTATGCQARMKPDGTPSRNIGCYVYKDAGCSDAIGLKDANPADYIGDKELTRKLSLDYPLDGSMFRWSSEPCIDWKTQSGALGCPSSGCIAASPSHVCASGRDEGQCCWSSLMEAKARCGAWFECKGFWGPRNGKYYARGKGYVDWAWTGVTAYIKPNPPVAFTLSGSTATCVNGQFRKTGTKNGAPLFENSGGAVVKYENTEHDWGYKNLCARTGCWTIGCGGHHRHVSVSDVKEIVNGMNWSNREGMASGVVQTVLGRRRIEQRLKSLIGY